MKKILVIAIILIIGAFGLGVGSGLGNQLKNDTQEVLPAKETAQTPPTAIPQKEYEPPVSISIPKINVNANVESVGMDEKKNMDTPKNADNVAWYNLGYKPGQKGNSVLAGHYDKVDGSPAVFWDLTKLSQGDEIIVTDKDGNETKFAVTRIEKYPYDDFPLQEVFGDTSDAMLNLITCEGDWNSATGMYSHRNVVYSKLIE